MKENEEGVVGVVTDGMVEESPVVGVDDADVCVAFYELLGYRSLVSLHCNFERCVRSKGVDIRAHLKENLNRLGVPCYHGLVESCLLSYGALVLEFADCGSAATFFVVLAGCRVHHRCKTVGAPPFHVDAGIEYLLELFWKVEADRVDQWRSAWSVEFF